MGSFVTAFSTDPLNEQPRISCQSQPDNSEGNKVHLMSATAVQLLSQIALYMSLGTGYVQGMYHTRTQGSMYINILSVKAPAPHIVTVYFCIDFLSVRIKITSALLKKWKPSFPGYLNSHWKALKRCLEIFTAFSIYYTQEFNFCSCEVFHHTRGLMDPFQKLS